MLGRLKGASKNWFHFVVFMPCQGCTPAHHAAQNDACGALKILKELEVDLDAQDSMVRVRQHIPFSLALFSPRYTIDDLWAG